MEKNWGDTPSATLIRITETISTKLGTKHFNCMCVES